MPQDTRRNSLDISVDSAADIACKKFWVVRLIVLVILGTLIGEFISITLLPSRASQQAFEELRELTKQNADRLKKIEEEHTAIQKRLP